MYNYLSNEHTVPLSHALFQRHLSCLLSPHSFYLFVQFLMNPSHGFLLSIVPRRDGIRTLATFDSAWCLHQRIEHTGNVTLFETDSL
jgi:hypothetical protein